MKAPKCKLCGHEHWANAPHVFGAKSLESFKREREERRMPGHSRRKREKDAALLAESVCIASEPKKSAINAAINKEERTPNRRKRSKYNEYMKGYMAKRRAQKKRK